MQQETRTLTGNEAVALATKQLRPHVVAAYPITPQTGIIETFSEYVSNGEVDTELVLAESEHSAMSICVGAAAAGSRVATATSSQGLALMAEIVYIAAGMRLPMVMAVTNRALSGPLNIHCDHSDSMMVRDSGWIQIFCRDAQEAYDSILIATRLSEKQSVRLPAMVCYDGFFVSHNLTPVQILTDESVFSFVGPFKAGVDLLDTLHPATMGALALQNYYLEFKRAQAEAMRQALDWAPQIQEEFRLVSGRSYGMFQQYRLEDAQLVLIALGSVSRTAEVVVDRLRSAGWKVGILAPRFYRPFPRAELSSALVGKRAIAVLDRADSCGAFTGPLGLEVKSALFDHGVTVPVWNMIYGLGGRNITEQDIEGIFFQLLKIVQTGTAPPEDADYFGVREGPAEAGGSQKWVEVSTLRN
ncbi:MAG: pyruvate ferredoxin oxidoreductase [Acidobacteria bacterium]|nr:pyruvate ferredoxin oxidoreductase [Acidobacteriota bacterium]